MNKLYTAAFLIPASATRQLTDDGWEFSTADRLPGWFLQAFVERLHLVPTEFYLGIQVYQAEGIKASVVFDEFGRIENINMQLRTRSVDEIADIVDGVGDRDIVFFVPQSSSRQTG